MEKQFIYITDEKTLERKIESSIRKVLIGDDQRNSDFENDKLSIAKAAKLAGMSVPTFNKRVENGIFRKHGTGRKIFFLKSEIIEDLKNNA
ncbi:helix-turn-helix domain-containing protein [Sunxiuqinia sp. A32]|uniref:helix-turn-helix domain-containing protein n=1 Tax=Sunxiuqinia sp. A32 TaxID=3461496 RepID=UPI004045BC6C